MLEHQGDGRFDGPAGQVIEFLAELGHDAFVEPANFTEQAAHNGQTQLQGGGMPMGMPMGVPIGNCMQAPGDMPPHLACLSAFSTMEVREQVNVIEAITALIGVEVEMANKYQITTEGGQQELFFAVEETDCCTRQLKGCFPDCAPWKLDMLYTQGGQQQLVYRMERPWTCTCLCFNRPVVEMTDMMTMQKVGSIIDPWACCDLTFRIRDANDQEVLKAVGGCCQWGLCCPLPCGPCSEVNFPIQDVTSGNEVGHLQKKVPSCCTWCCAPDVDNYTVQFGGVTHPQWKALLLGLAIFTDFRYFNDNANDDPTSDF